jgi:predicted RNase H-like HicB family nuclease
MDYIAYLHKDLDSDYGVSFPDFPGCITAGKTLQEARRNAEEALSLHIAGMAEDGEAIPEPSTLDDIAADPARKDALTLVVSVDSGKRVRVNITAMESQIHKIDRMAHQAGMTRSAFVVQAAIHAPRNEGLQVRHRKFHQERVLAKRRMKAARATNPAHKQRVVADRVTHDKPARETDKREHVGAGR